jgi:hypothetical protein
MFAQGSLVLVTAVLAPGAAHPSRSWQERDSGRPAPGSLGNHRPRSVVKRVWGHSWLCEEDTLWTEMWYQADR